MKQRVVISKIAKLQCWIHKADKKPPRHCISRHRCRMRAAQVQEKRAIASGSESVPDGTESSAFNLVVPLLFVRFLELWLVLLDPTWAQ